MSELPYVNRWSFVTSRGHCIKKQRQNKLCDLCSFRCIWKSSSCTENDSFIHPSRTNGHWCTAKPSLQCKWPGSESSFAWGLFTVRRSYIQIILRCSIIVHLNYFMMSPAHLFYWATLVLDTTVLYILYLLIILQMFHIGVCPSNIWPAHKCFWGFFLSLKLHHICYFAAAIRMDTTKVGEWFWDTKTGKKLIYCNVVNWNLLN